MYPIYPGLTERPSPLVRGAWAVAAVGLLAFGVFEMVKHGGWATGLGVFAVIAPDLVFLLAIGAPPTTRGALPRRVVPFYNVAHFWLLPVLVLVWFTVVTDTNAEAAPGFTLGLMWLAHICVDNAVGYGLRAREGRQRWEPAG